MKKIIIVSSLLLLLKTINIIAYTIYENSAEYVNVGFDNCDMHTNGEEDIISHFIKNRETVFDIGANVGSWSQKVLTKVNSPLIFAFEPIPETFKILQNNLNHPNVHIFNFAFADIKGFKSIAYYDASLILAELSSFYPRPIVEEMHQTKPTFLKVPTHSIDSFCKEKKINRIHFLKIDTEGSELDILKGSIQALAHKTINCIQFEYGGTYQDAKTTLQEVYQLLTQNGYIVFRIIPEGLIKISQWSNDLENYRYSNYLALVDDALLATEQNSQPAIILPLLPVKSGKLGWAGGPLNKSFLQTIQKIFDTSLLIETGTYRGDSSAIAGDIFEQVYTIELSPSLYEKACQRFINDPSILLYCGDSAIVLEQILSSLQKKAVLWLDGHWSGGETAKGTTNTPILEELNAVKKSMITNSIILIDDIRLFQKSTQKNIHISLEGYPELNIIIDAIRQINPNYSVWVYGDILIAFSDSNISVAPIIRAMTVSRLNIENENNLLEAETIIANATEEEICIIKDLCNDFADDGGYGFNRYYHFWYALTLLKRNETLAYSHMKLASHGGCRRAEYYLQSWQWSQDIETF